MQRTDIAHHEWDRRWQTTEGRAEWLKPEAEVTSILPVLHDRGVQNVLDLGCGVGRHALMLATEGFTVTAMDGSRSGLDVIATEAADKRLEMTTTCAEMTALPFDDHTFDYLLAWNVIYHGNKYVVDQVIAEIYRVLRPAGLVQLTMLSHRNTETQVGKRVSEGTYINPGLSDKAHPHYYCNEMQLREQFGQFRIIELSEQEHARPGSFHWHLVVERHV